MSFFLSFEIKIERREKKTAIKMFNIVKRCLNSVYTIFCFCLLFENGNWQDEDEREMGKLLRKE